MGYVKVSGTDDLPHFGGTDDLPRFGGLGSDAKKAQLSSAAALAKLKQQTKVAQDRAARSLRNTPQMKVLNACFKLAKQRKIDLPTLFADYTANGYQVWVPWSLGGGPSPVAVLADICAQFMEKNPTLTDSFLSGYPAEDFTYVFWKLIVKAGHPELAGNVPGLLAMIRANGVSPCDKIGQYSVAAWCLRSLIAGTPDFQLKRHDGSATVASASNGVAIQAVSAPPAPAVDATGGGGASADASGGSTAITDDSGTTVDDGSGGGGVPSPDDSGGGAPSLPRSGKRTALYVGGGLGLLGLGYVAWKAFKG